MRVVASIAEHLGLAPHGCLPLPIQGFGTKQRAREVAVLDQLDLT